MFEFITNREERGQVGIGTLIVFIAMVLVAAIAAGVLINTAGFLQTQAEATGEDSTDLVSERIDVMSEVGIVGDSTAGTLDEIRLSVTGAPGAGQIDLTETTIQAVGPGGQNNLVFTNTASDANEVTQVSVPALEDSEADTETIEVDYSNIEGFSSGDSLTMEVSITDSGGNSKATKTVTNTDLSTTDITFQEGDGSGDIDFDSTSLSQEDEVTVDILDGGNTVLAETVTQTVEPVQLEVGPVTDGESSVAIDLTYDNIESIDGTDDTQTLVVTYEPTGTETTVTASDFSGSSLTITAIDGTAEGALEIDASGGAVAGDFSSGEDITVELSDDSGTVGTATTTVDDVAGQLISISNAEATTVFGESVENLGENEFAVGEDGDFEDAPVLNDEQDYTILINPSAGAFNSGTFGEGNTATVDIVSPAGATTQVELRAPDLFSEDGEAVQL